MSYADKKEREDLINKLSSGAKSVAIEEQLGGDLHKESKQDGIDCMRLVIHYPPEKLVGEQYEVDAEKREALHQEIRDFFENRGVIVSSGYHPDDASLMISVTDRQGPKYDAKKKALQELKVGIETAISLTR